MTQPESGRARVRHRLDLRTFVRRRRRTQAGYAAILVAMLSASILLPLSALAVDVSRWYVEAERVQNAADAAAMAGVTFLPVDLASATATAKTVTSRNGYTDGGNSTVTVGIGPKPTQLVVTISTTIPNSIAASFNQSFATITRSATADYNGPAPMGSPCNTFGNEPAQTSGSAVTPNQGSILSVPTGASCPQVPKFWAHVAGPNIYKIDGDQLMSRYCSGGEDGCSGSTNQEFRPEGYFYIVRVAPSAVGQAITLQVYDPAYAYTGQQCTTNGTTFSWNSSSTNSPNPYVNDARVRYLTFASGVAANQFCAGDNRYTASSGGDVATTTSFGLRQPVDTFVPQQGAPISGCVKQYPGYTQTQVTNATLTSSNAAYNQKLAAVFHRWVNLCTFTPTRSGDYYLQVRTNVQLNTSNYDNMGGYSGNMAVFNQTSDDLNAKGSGGNEFAIRATSPTPGAVSVSGWERMGIWMNSDAVTSTMNLVRVVPAAASKTLVFEFFDGGEGAVGGTFKVLPPIGSSTTLTNCVGAGKVNGPLANCSITGVSSSAGWNGRSQQVRVPIPATYTCNASNPAECWFRVEVSFGSGQVHDVTTWSARIEGDPVRLIK